MNQKEKEWLASLLLVRDILDRFSIKYILDTGTLLVQSETEHLFLG